MLCVRGERGLLLLSVPEEFIAGQESQQQVAIGKNVKEEQAAEEHE